MTGDGAGRYRAGVWYVLVTPDAVVMVDDGLPAAHLCRLWDVVRGGAGTAAIVAELAGTGDRSYGVAVCDPDGVTTAVDGGVTLAADAGQVRLARDGAAPGEDAVLPLGCGVVRADEVVWTPRRGAATRPVTVVPGRPRASGAAPGPDEPADRTLVPGWTGEDWRRADAPAGGAARQAGAELVQAVHCSADHPNPVQAAYCRTCGEALGFSTPRLVPRPPLGRLRFSTGQEVPLDRNVVVGRAPRADRVHGGGLPRPVRIEGRGLDVSRNHLEVRLEGWHVLVVDLGSRNGTLVTLPGREPQRVDAGVPCLITAGTVVELTEDVTFRYEAAP